MTPADEVLAWLLDGDVAVRWQTRRDLLDDREPGLRARIGTEGRGGALLAARGTDGHWGRGFYQPKWTSSHYTLLELMNLGVPHDTEAARETAELILETELGPDGRPTRSLPMGDLCVAGMTLGYAAYFRCEGRRLDGLVGFVLDGQLDDGGFNCRVRTNPQIVHSSVHTSVSVLEGLTSYLGAGYRHRRGDVAESVGRIAEFFLRHRMFRSERSGEPMHPEFTRLHHPARWHFDVLRGLEAFRVADRAQDPRLEDALEVVRSRRRPDGRWRAAAPYRGATHLPHDRQDADRWVSLGALRVLHRYDVPGAA